MGVIREATYKTCGECSSRRLSREEVWGCDNCGDEIDHNNKNVEYLRAQVFSNKHETVHLEFCSWECAITKLSNTTTDYFISLPYLTFDGSRGNLSAAAFWKIVRAGIGKKPPKRTTKGARGGKTK